MINSTVKKKWQRKAEASYKVANRMSWGTLSILVHAIQTFIEARATAAAASLAYYTLFSLFPLLILLISLGTVVLESDNVVEQVLDLTSRFLPIAQDLVRETIEQALALRRTVGIAAGIGLLWAATSVFVLLADSINRAWRGAKPRNFFHGRLVGLIIVTILAGLIIMALLSSTIFSLLPQLDIDEPLWGGIPIYETVSWQLASRLVPWFFIFVMFLSLYRWIPRVKVGWSEAIWGALIATVAWETTKFGFTWYLSSGLARYHLVYGSLGAVVALMLWIYLSSVILLFGAHLSAAIAKHKRSRKR